MRATYTVFCNENGCLKDDAILYKFADDDYLLMPSDIDHSAYFGSLRLHLKLSEVSFAECTDSLAGVAIQGPLSAAVLQNMGFAGVELIKPFEIRDYTVAGNKMFISRMGFTADLGYECWFKPDLADTLMQCIRAARSAMKIALPGYGLGALQTCRLEGGFIVAGCDCATELDPKPDFERTPYELGLGWLVNLEAAPFVGRDALAAQKKNGHQFALRSFVMDARCLPDDGSDLFVKTDGRDTSIGIINCSSWSWGMNKTIGNASIQSEHAGTKEAWASIAGDRVKLALARAPLVSFVRRNQVPAPTTRPNRDHFHLQWPHSGNPK
jgi:glycine cleavage system T protein (aminomethyltransferase)